MEYKNLLIETDGNIATLTVNRPQSLNAMNCELLDELECALYKLGKDPGVRVVIVTGAGEKAFVAGADIKEMESLSPVEGHSFAIKGQRVMLMMQGMRKPVIAAVNGFALGGGLELALACDFIYASENAKVGFPEVTLGIMPGFGGTQNLARLIGPGKANELILSGKIIDARKACDWGIVNEVFPSEVLMAKAKEIASVIVMRSPLGVAYARDAISNGLNMAKDDGFRYEASLFGVLFGTGDRKEGMRAFIEKRQAKFEGK